MNHKLIPVTDLKVGDIVLHSGAETVAGRYRIIFVNLRDHVHYGSDNLEDGMPLDVQCVATHKVWIECDD
jgi:hypothetical protein